MGITEHRDLQAANAVAEMYRLGRFETEFIIYGSAVQDFDGKIYYYATTNRERLHQYIEKSCFEKRYFMPIVKYDRRLQLPADLKEEWLKKIKIALIKAMKFQYEKCILLMQPFFKTEANNEAIDLLNDVQEAIDGYFDDALLQCFMGLVEISYKAKVLSQENYKRFDLWHSKVRRQMVDDPVWRDNIVRVFYGFIYVDNEGRRQCIFDAQKMNVVEKYNEKILSGYLVAPIVKKQYAFKQFGEIPEVRQAFKQWLTSTETEKYLSLIQKIKSMPGVINKNELSDLRRRVVDKQDALKAIDYYQALWNINP